MEENTKSNLSPDLHEITIDGDSYFTKLTRRYANRRNYEPKNMKKVQAFIPGTIRQILVKEGQKVKEGDPLVVLEAMKMYNKVLAPIDGKIKLINVRENEAIAKNVLIVEIE